MLEHRPCGACGELVSVVDGCAHWKPGVKSGKKLGWVRKPKPPTADSLEVATRTVAVLAAGGLTTR